MIGVMGIAGPGYDSWIANDVCHEASVGRPSDTIMLGERADVNNQMDFSPGCLLGIWFWGSPPTDGTAPAAAYPNGPNGAVTANHNNMANFTFCDGHVKAMMPPATNPDPNNHPENNMWDASRQ
jgi:prepilin-type processing-associated H-X9-DG protein